MTSRSNSEPLDLTARGTVFEQVGGMDTFRRLADAFYTRVETDAFLRPMFGQDLGEAREHLALFLAQYFGGPVTYSEQRGHPRLRMRHMPFKIGRAERDAWLRHMLAALDEVGIAEPAHTAMRAYFDHAATFLMNKAE